MVDVAKLIERIRVNGANVIIDAGKLRIINSKKLPDGALDFIKQHGKDIAGFIEQEAEADERAAIIEFDGGLTRPAAEYLTRLLLSSAPHGVVPADWTWFVGKAAKIMDAAPLRRAA
ncbi:hypothetical protein [Mesorhizobium sp. A556]